MRSDAQSGFTLVEVLIALAILGLSFTVLYRIMSDDLERTRRARDEAVAMSLLQSTMALAEAQSRPQDSDGNTSNGFAWRVAVEPAGGARAGWPVDAVTLTATVSWRDGKMLRTRSLSELRVVPKAAAR
ncbi:MAG TPA: type II secretion system protein [Rhizomicrobium sp.]|jgi:general secretion pathway protein I|nr:type II secretion system protein [Rhizomicrobium sp.]